MKEIGHFIGGKHVAGTSGRTSNVFNPATGEVQATVALASEAEIRAAVENAKQAQPKWAATNPQRRARVFFKFVELLNTHMDELATLISSEHARRLKIPRVTSFAVLKSANSSVAFRTCPRASSPKVPVLPSTCIPSASQLASVPVSRRSTSRP